MLRGDVTITTIDLSCVKIMSVKLHAEYRILWASLCASFAQFSQKLREWQHQSAYFFNNPRTILVYHKIICSPISNNEIDSLSPNMNIKVVAYVKAFWPYDSNNSGLPRLGKKKSGK